MNINFKIETSALQLAANRIVGAIADRNLTFVALRVKNKKLDVAINDQFMAVYSSFPCHADQDGFAFVYAQTFVDVVRELPEGFTTIISKGSSLHILAGEKNQFFMKLPLVETGLWREPDDFSGIDNSIEISSEVLRYMIEQVAFTIDPGCSRVYGTVAHFHRPQGQPDVLRLVGTDSYRLSYCEVRIAMADSFLKEGMSLSKKNLLELEKIASEGFEKVKLSIVNGKYLVAEVPGFNLFLLLSAVRYPNYAAAIPRLEASTGVLVDREQIRGVARRVLLASDKSRILSLAFDNSELRLSSQTVGSSEGRESIELPDFSGAKCELTVNGKYLSDVFSSVSCDRIALQFKSPKEPFVVVPYGEPTGRKTMHVLVPIDQQ